MKNRLAVSVGVCLMTGWGLGFASETGSDDPPSGNDSSGGNSTIETLYNPTVSCVVQPGQTMGDVLACLAESIVDLPPSNQCDIVTASHGGGNVVDVQQTGDDCEHSPEAASDFISWAGTDGRTLFVFKRVPDAQGNDETDRLIFRENDTGVKRTFIQVQRDKRVARIAALQEEPAGDGLVVIRLNGEEIPVVLVSTAHFPSSVEVMAEIMTQFRDAGYDTMFDGGYIYVRGGRSLPTAEMWRLDYEATDTGLTMSDVALVEPTDVDWGLEDPHPRPRERPLR